MSRRDEVWTTAHNVLHFGPWVDIVVRDKDCSGRPSHPIMRQPCVDLEEKQDPCGGMMKTEKGERSGFETNDMPAPGRSVGRWHQAAAGILPLCTPPILIKPGAVLAAVKDAARRAKSAVAYGHP
jgi:hypothetical protein